jgi:hypothetical protein
MSEARRSVAAPLVIVALVACAIVLAALLLPDRTPAPAPPPRPVERSAPPTDRAVTGWRALPADRLGGAEGSPAIAWTGRAVVAISSENGGSTAGVVGARIDLAADIAAPIAPSPLAWRTNPAVAWTGTELIVAGGSAERGLETAGAAYDPALDRWRTIAPPPGFRPGRSAYSIAGPAAWDGRRMVVWSAALAYDPVADAWESIPPAPLAARTGEAVAATGAGVVVWGGCDGAAVDCAATPEAWLHDGAWFDSATGRWSVLPPAPLDAAPGAAAAVLGDTVHVVAGGPRSPARHAAYQPRTGTWSPLAPPPAPVPPGSVLTAAGDRLFATGRMVSLAYEPASDAWRPMEGSFPSRRSHAAVWTGAELVVAGGIPDGRPFAYRDRAPA